METVREIIRDGLERLGADGLCNCDMECGCHLSELAPGINCLDPDNCVAAKMFLPDEDLIQRTGFACRLYKPMHPEGKR